MVSWGVVPPSPLLIHQIEGSKGQVYDEIGIEFESSLKFKKNK